ncbi:MAG: hypothetical protein WCF04_10520, partial [Candidatus Nanopelagicales bacterium]
MVLITDALEALLNAAVTDLELLISERGHEPKLTAERVNIPIKDLEARWIAVLDLGDPPDAHAHGLGDLLLGQSLSSTDFREGVGTDSGQHLCRAHRNDICAGRLDVSLANVGPLLDCHHRSPSSNARSLRDSSYRLSAWGIARRYHFDQPPDLSPATSRIALRHGSNVNRRPGDDQRVRLLVRVGQWVQPLIDIIGQVY